MVLQHCYKDLLTTCICTMDICNPCIYTEQIAMQESLKQSSHLLLPFASSSSAPAVQMPRRKLLCQRDCGVQAGELGEVEPLI